MKNITATYKNNKVTFLEEETSAEIGKIIYEKNKKPRLIFDKEEYSIVRTSKNEIEILKNDEKIESLSRDKFSGNYQFKNSAYQIKGISSWKGGTKLVDESENTISTIQNKSAWIDKGIYKFEIFDRVETYQLALILHLHIQGSEAKTKAVLAASVVTQLLLFSIVLI